MRSDQPLLRIRGLRKCFYPHTHSRRAALAALLGWRGAAAGAAHTVLRDIDLDLWPGEALAIIGRNGSGKSTLLKLITGSLLPDEGTIECRGRISALIELGAGFDLAATGRQNMALQAALWGVAADVLARQADAIITYSELGTAIDEPVRTYSSGMLLRLAFAIAIHAQAELLIIDEALAVGDARFQQKCLASIRQHLARGGGLLFVSHDLNSVKTLCQRAILLDDGAIRAQGQPAAVCDAYLSQLLGAGSASAASGEQDSADTPATVTALLLNGRPTRDIVLRSGDWLDITVHLRANQSVQQLAAGFMLHDARGQDLFGVNTHLAGHRIDLTHPGDTCTVTLRAQLLLGAGHYTVTVAVHDALDYTRNVIYWQFGAIAIEIVDPDSTSVGHCRLPYQLNVAQSSSAAA
ncbi:MULTISPECIES: ABC transporter ATP-binding protein [Tepidimonas]|nr:MULTISPECIES: ABC transporter ATP-binding protein [Tepidimonas]